MSFEDPHKEFIARVKAPRPRSLAIMFADLDNFTRICLDHPPESVLALVGHFQRIVRDVIVSFGGKLNFFQGDGVLATFGEATGKVDCATRSLGCAQIIASSIRSLTPYFNGAGDCSISVSVGLQYGDVWTYKADASRRFGPTIIGDAINVATKLEQRARALSATIVAGDTLMQKARCESGPDHPSLAQFVSMRPLFIAGRRAPVDVWALGRLDEPALQTPFRSLDTICETRPAAIPARRDANSQHPARPRQSIDFTVVRDRATAIQPGTTRQT